MPTSPAWPGVYIEELPSGVRTITGVATSVTAFVGRTLRGSTTEPITCFSWADFERTCGGLWDQVELPYLVAQFFANGGGQAVISRVIDPAATASTCTAAGTTSGELKLEARDPGEWGKNLRATVDHGTAGTPSETPDTDTFHLTIDEVDRAALDAGTPYEEAVITRESFPGVSVVPGSPRDVDSVVENRSMLARVLTVPVGRPQVTSQKNFIGGTDGAAPAQPAFDAAVDRLDFADVVNLVCIPPPTRDTDTTASTWTFAQAWCERHRAILLVDPPSAWATAQDAADLDGGYDAYRSENTAYYFPRIEAPDPLRANLARPFAPSGAVAGLIARTDADRGVWKAPAGASADLRSISGFERTLTDDEIGLMNPRGVNALRLLDVSGAVVWGARTGRGADTMASDWKYLPVRRTALYIEESLFRGTKWAVFEPNDEPLWSELRLAVGSFMHDLFRQGAFAGRTPREAYRVVCDDTTTIQADIDRGIVNILVAFAPLKPAEFVVVKFQQIAGQAAV